MKTSYLGEDLRNRKKILLKLCPTKSIECILTYLLEIFHKIMLVILPLSDKIEPRKKVLREEVICVFYKAITIRKLYTHCSANTAV